MKVGTMEDTEIHIGGATKRELNSLNKFLREITGWDVPRIPHRNVPLRWMNQQIKVRKLQIEAVKAGISGVRVEYDSYEEAKQHIHSLWPRVARRKGIIPGKLIRLVYEDQPDRIMRVVHINTSTITLVPEEGGRKLAYSPFNLIRFARRIR